MSRPVFGVDRDAGVMASLLPRSKSGTLKVNPMPLHYGPGPEGKRCATCVHLERHAYGKTWFKCALRRNTSSTATDHRSRWPACGRYEEDAP